MKTKRQQGYEQTYFFCHNLYNCFVTTQIQKVGLAAGMAVNNFQTVFYISTPSANITDTNVQNSLK